MAVRFAKADDVETLLKLADQKRTEYEHYVPNFWRKAVDGLEKQRSFFQDVLTKPNVLVLVSEENNLIDGFLIASIVKAPPVYDPQSEVCMIDDFTVVDSTKWATVGRDLLEEARRQAAQRQAHLSVVVCGHKDEPKREMLKAAGFGLASEWYVNPL